MFEVGEQVKVGKGKTVWTIEAKRHLPHKNTFVYDVRSTRSSTCFYERELTKIAN